MIPIFNKDELDLISVAIDCYLEVTKDVVNHDEPEEEIVILMMRNILSKLAESSTTGHNATKS